jgi:hypothetical protein
MKNAVLTRVNSTITIDPLEQESESLSLDATLNEGRS